MPSAPFPAPPAGPSCPVVLVHGIFDRGLTFSRMRRRFEARGFTVHAPDLTPSSGRTGLDVLAQQLKDFVEVQMPRGAAFDVVAFSMGGLVARYYVQRLGGAARVRRLVTLSTPHHGSYWAWSIPNRGCRQMRPGSAFLANLNADAHTLHRHGFVSLWTPFDLMIRPPRSSVLEVGTVEALPVAAHPLMLHSRRVFERVVEALQA